MITDVGKEVIKKFFGLQTASIGGALVLGTGDAAADASDVQLNFEVARLQVVSVNPDLDNDRIVFKAVMPAGTINQIYEVGLLHVGDDTSSRAFGVFEGSEAEWTEGTLSTDNARRGVETLLVSASTSDSTLAELVDQSIDISSFAVTDSLAVAYTADANLSNLEVRIGADSSNYRKFTFVPDADGYNTQRMNLSAGVDTGTVDLAAINYVAVLAVAGSGGPTDLYLDAITVEDNTSLDELVVRYVPGSPITTNTLIETEIEFSIGITV